MIGLSLADLPLRDITQRAREGVVTSVLHNRDVRHFSPAYNEIAPVTFSHFRRLA
jgi:hypothetical protein